MNVCTIYIVFFFINSLCIGSVNTDIPDIE